MSFVHKALALFLMTALLPAAGCASRAHLPVDTAASKCSAAAACTGSVKRDAVEALGRQDTGIKDLSLPPSALTSLEALRDSADVKAALARSDAAYADIADAKSMSKPQATFDLSGNVLSARRQPFDGAEPDKAYSYGLTVNVPLYQGGRDKAALAVALATFRAAVENAKDVLISNSLSLVSAQAEIRRTEGAVAILARHRTALKALRRNVVGERDAGTATIVDIGEVDRQLIQIDVEQKQLLLQRAQSEQTLTRLNVTRAVPIAVAADAVSRKLPGDLPQLVELALRNNPRIAQRLAQMDVAQGRVEQAKSAYNPNLSLALTAAVEGSPSSSTDHYRESKALMRLSVPLYNGGAREAGIDGRKADFLASALEKDSALMGVYASVKSAFERQAFARQMLVLARHQYAVSQSQIRKMKQERTLGERTVFDEIRSIADSASAEMNVNTATYELALSQYILAAETGILDDVLGVKLEAARLDKPVPEAAPRG